MDAFEEIVPRYVKHRSTLSRQRQSALEFKRGQRPGVASKDMDFGENFTIESFRKVQSEVGDKQ